MLPLGLLVLPPSPMQDLLDHRAELASIPWVGDLWQGWRGTLLALLDLSEVSPSVVPSPESVGVGGARCPVAFLLFLHLVFGRRGSSAKPLICGVPPVDALVWQLQEVPGWGGGHCGVWGHLCSRQMKPLRPNTQSCFRVCWL